MPEVAALWSYWMGDIETSRDKERCVVEERFIYLLKEVQQGGAARCLDKMEIPEKPQCWDCAIRQPGVQAVDGPM